MAQLQLIGGIYYPQERVDHELAKTYRTLMQFSRAFKYLSDTSDDRYRFVSESIRCLLF